MGTSVLIIGKSGTGKSRSMLNLDPATTFLVNVNGKSLPFRGYKSKYRELGKGNPTGNMVSVDDPERIVSAINYVNAQRPEVRVAVIDDYQYVMANEFMKRSGERGYDKFTEIAEGAWRIIRACNSSRDDLVWVILSHSDENERGEVKVKTIGKMLDEKICLEGMFTIVFNTSVVHADGKTEYFFETQSDGRSTAKSPEGMFERFRIPNDLKLVVDTITNYNEGEQE